MLNEENNEISQEQSHRGKGQKLLFRIASVILIFAIGFLAGNFIEIMPGEGMDISLLNKLKNRIDQNYYKEYDFNKVQDMTLAGMVAGLNDPYSYYLPEIAQEDFDESVTGSYVGIGVTISPDEKDYSIKVVSPMDGSPAAKAGIQAGDKIVKINGEDYTYERIEDALKLMRGKAGEKVSLEIAREGMDDFTVEVEKAKIETPSVEAKIIDDNIAYVRISRFDMTTYDDMLKALNEIEITGTNGMIMDLRNNGGGVVDIAADIADSFLEEGNIVTLKCKNQPDKSYDAKKGVLNVKTPIVVLVNSSSASASEILSAALQENGKAVLVGEKTYGKGVVNQKFKLTDKTSVVLTVGEYFTPAGKNIHGVGIEPDVPVEMSKELKAKITTLPVNEDVQLLEAINQVKKVR